MWALTLEPPGGTTWERREWELYDTREQIAGFGSWITKQLKSIGRIAAKPVGLISKKLEKNLVKISDKAADNLNSVATKINKGAQSVGKWAKKNWKVLAIVAAIAITIYSMGSGAGIAAKLLSGCKVIAAKAGSLFVAKGAAVGAATAGTTAATAGTAAVAATAATSAGIGVTGWATIASTAMAGATKLLEAKKVSELSAEEAQAMQFAQSQGVELMTPELQALIAKRAALGNVDANGNPVPPGTPGSMPGYTPTGNALPGWIIPAAAGVLLLLLVK